MEKSECNAGGALSVSASFFASTALRFPPTLRWNLGIHIPHTPSKSSFPDKILGHDYLTLRVRPPVANLPPEAAVHIDARPILGFQI
jgi:hypothetical protein